MTDKYNFKFELDGKRYDLTASLKDGKLTSAKCNADVEVIEPDELGFWMIVFHTDAHTFEMVFADDDFCHMNAWSDDGLKEVFLADEIDYTIR